VLTVQIAATATDPEHLMLIERPVNGRVLVKEWVGEGFGAPAVEREYDTIDLYRMIDDASRQGRRVGQELYRVRLWLDGIDAP
jgi:hypothetical protein